MKHTRPTARPTRHEGRRRDLRTESLPYPPRRVFGAQAGYTLIEMVIVIAITGLLILGINQVISHTIRISSQGTDTMTAIKQVENTLHWVNIDVQQARIIEPELGDGFPLSLSWVEWDGTHYAVTYSISGSELTRSISTNGGPPTDMVIARYIDTDTAATNCRLTGNGSFSLTDAGDSFTITGGQQASSGQILVTTGSVSVTTTGTATYSDGTWTTPAVGDEVIVTATSATTTGAWNAVNTAVSLALTQDSDDDASLRGNALRLILTAFGGDGSTHSETREGMIFSRS